MSDPRTPPVSDRFRFRWDLLLFVAFLVSCAPSFTGVPLHEWISLALVPVLGIHVMANWDWIVDVFRRTGRRLPGEVRVNQVLNTLTFLTFTLLMVSGIKVSEAALPALGLAPGPDPFWTRIHNTVANVFPSLIGIHVAMHARWIWARIRRRPPAAQQPEAG